MCLHLSVTKMVLFLIENKSMTEIFINLCSEKDFKGFNDNEVVAAIETIGITK